MKSKIKRYSISIFVIFLLLLGAFLLFKDRCFVSHQEEIKDKTFYAKVVHFYPSRVAITWSNPSGSDANVYLFVLSNDNEEQLFAAGKAGTSETGDWIFDGRTYEFHLYEDQERTKPIAKLVFVKNGNVIKQETMSFTEGSNNVQSPAPIVSSTQTQPSVPTPTPSQNPNSLTKKIKHKEKK